MADYSLGEYMAQAQRSLGGGQFGRVSGPLSGYLFGPDFFRKQTYLQVADTFVATYGKKVWDSLNNKTVTFNAIKKVDWGPTVGWRLRTDRGSNRSRPVTEVGTLPTIDVSNYVGVYAYPKTIVTTFGVSLKSQAVSALEGGIGNQFAVEQEASSRDHVKEIEQELVAGSSFIISGGANSDTGTFIVGTGAASWAMASNFKIGDTLVYGNQSDSYNQVAGGSCTAVSTADGTIGTSGHSGTPASTDILYITARAGLTSIDDCTQSLGSTVGGATTDKIDVNLYNLSTRTAGGYKGGANTAPYAAGVPRDLTIPLVDSGFQTIRQNGGEPKLIVTGLDQYDNFNQLLQAQQRFVDVTDFIVGVGDDRTYPGTRAGFQLATYRGVPILPDPDTTKSLNTSNVCQGSDFYMLDTDYLEIAVMYPTQYVENRDYFAANALVIRGMFITMMELRCLRPDLQYKISDLKA